MAKSKIQRGYYPIGYAELIQKIRVCFNWGYGNKDTCKYVAETTIERIEIDYPDLPIKDTLRNELVQIAHNLNQGKRYTDKLEIPIVD
jgi:hypothetical protein